MPELTFLDLKSAELQVTDPVEGKSQKQEDSIRFFSEKELKDMGVRLALTGGTFNEALERLQAVHRARLAEKGAAFDADVKVLNYQIERIEEEIKEQKAQIEKVRKEEEELLGRRNQFEADLVGLLQQRPDREKDFLKAQQERLEMETRSDYEAILADVNRQKEVAGKIAEVYNEDLDVNKEVYQRTINHLEEDRLKVEDEYNETQWIVSGLRLVGITRTTTGFLIWAGYSALAGMAYVLTKLFEKPPDKADSPDKFIAFIAQFAGNLVRLIQNPPRWEVYGRAVAFVVLGGVLLWLIIRIMKWVDRFLHGFSPRWRRHQEDSNKRGSENKFAENSSENDFLSRISGISRDSYVKFIATTPYVFIAIIILALSAVSQEGWTTRVSFDPVDFFSAASLGFVFTFLILTTSLLYTVAIIEPRWKRLFTNRFNPPEKGLLWRAHKEVFILIILLVVIVITQAVLSSKPHWYAAAQKLPIAFVTLFMCLSSIGLSYGVTQRGRFRNLLMLEQRRNEHRNRIRRFSRRKTMWELVDYDSALQAVRRLFNRHAEQTGLSDPAQPETGSGGGGTRWLLRNISRGKRGLSRQLKKVYDRLSALARRMQSLEQEQTEAASNSAASPAEAAANPLSAQLKGLPHYEAEEQFKWQQIADAGKKIDETTKQIADFESQIRKCYEERDKKEQERQKLRQIYEEGRKELLLMQEREQLAFGMAFTLGDKLRRILG